MGTPASNVFEDIDNGNAPEPGLAPVAVTAQPASSAAPNPFEAIDNNVGAPPPDPLLANPDSAGIPAAMHSTDPKIAGAAERAYAAAGGPSSNSNPYPGDDLSQWLTYQLHGLASGIGDVPWNLVGKEGPFSAGAEPEGSKRVSKAINDFTGQTAETARGPTPRQLAVEPGSGTLGDTLGLNTLAQTPEAQRVASGVINALSVVEPVKGLLGGTDLVGGIEGNVARAARESNVSPTLATPPKPGELLDHPNPKPPATEAPAEAPEVTHTDMGQGLHSFKTANGETLAQESGDHLLVKRQDVKPEAQGQGEGTAALNAAHDLAKEKGLTLGSDVSMSPAAVGTWDKFARENGVELQRNPSQPSQSQPGGLVSADPRKPVLEVAKPGPQLNVGMDVKGGTPLTHDQVVQAVERTGAKVTNSSIHQSGTEPTVVATLDRPLTSAEGERLASELHQEAIPQRNAGETTGTMFGPKKDAWGPFNGEYFLDHNGQPIAKPAPEAAAATPTQPTTPQWGAQAPAARGERAATLDRLGIQETPNSALTGDLKESSNDAKWAKQGGPAGDRMSDLHESNNQSLSDQVDALKSSAGGKGGIENTNQRKQSGKVITDATDALNDSIDASKNAAYQEVKKIPGSIPTTEFSKVLNEIGDPKNPNGISSGDVGLFHKRLTNYLKAIGADGGAIDNAGVAENLRQFLGNEFKHAPQQVYALRDALDADVTARLGPGVADKARQMAAWQKQNLQSRDMKPLVASAGERARAELNNAPRPGLPLEDVTDHLRGLSADEFGHFVSTLRTGARMFPQLADKIESALKEIRSNQIDHIEAAGKPSQAGVWNAKKVTQEVAEQGPKYEQLWDNEHQQAIHDLQQGGEILKRDNSYKGPIAEASNLGHMIAEGGKTLAKVGAAHFGGPIGVLAELGVEKGAEAGLQALKGRAAQAAVESRIARIQDELPSNGPTEKPNSAPPAGGGSAAEAPFKLAQPEPLSAKLPGQRGGPKPTGPSALDQIKPYLQDDELPAKKDTAQRLVDFYHSLPPTAEKAAFAAEGASMRDWYRGGAEAIGGWFKQDAPRFTAVLAADSPQFPVASNLAESVNIWKAWHEAGRPTDRAAISKILSDVGAHLHGGAGVGESTILNNIHKALTAEDPSEVVLSGPKVHSFYKNLMGHVNEVTNDGWQAKGSSVDPAALGGSANAAGTKPGKGTTYIAMSAKTREAAALLSKISGEKWDPDQIQAGEWSLIKSAWELADKTGRSIPDLLKSGELNDEVIANTPSYQQLLDEHTDKLKSIGLEQPAGVRGGASGTAPSQATKTAREALRGELFKGAQRLEAYRQYLKNGGKPGTGPGTPYTGGAAGPDVPF